jgi:transcriptional regulator with XRE-family HTH domain
VRLHTDPLHRRVAARIRALAAARGLPLSHVADRAGVSRGHFTRVVNRRASPTLAYLVRIARALGVDPLELVAK